MTVARVVLVAVAPVVAALARPAAPTEPCAVDGGYLHLTPTRYALPDSMGFLQLPASFQTMESSRHYARWANRQREQVYAMWRAQPAAVTASVTYGTPGAPWEAPPSPCSAPVGRHTAQVTFVTGRSGPRDSVSYMANATVNLATGAVLILNVSGPSAVARDRLLSLLARTELRGERRN